MTKGVQLLTIHSTVNCVRIYEIELNYKLAHVHGPQVAHSCCKILVLWYTSSEFESLIW